MNAATQLFNIPELLELILLSLPNKTTNEEISSTRTLYLSRTATRTWHTLLQTSTPLRRNLYLATPLDATEAEVWSKQRTAFEPAHPNPWIPHLLLNQRSWGSAYPFETAAMSSLYEGVGGPSRPKFWTFSFELSRAQHLRLPAPGAWRETFAASPPFLEIWYTRCFYELGSGRAPFVTHVDYDPKKPKCEQRYRMRAAGGITLGMLVDAVSELFERYPNAKFVLVESVRRPASVVKEEEEGPGTSSVSGDIATTSISEEDDDRPTTKMYLPGSSAEKAYGWH